MKNFKNVDEYIKSFPKAIQVKLKEFRKIIIGAIPKSVKVEETISYGMPAYKVNGKSAVYFGGFTKHVSFFPTGSGIANFKKELAKYKTSKGTIKFPLDEKLPARLIAKITKFRVNAVQNSHK